MKKYTCDNCGKGFKIGMKNGVYQKEFGHIRLSENSGVTLKMDITAEGFNTTVCGGFYQEFNVDICDNCLFEKIMENNKCQNIVNI